MSTFSTFQYRGARWLKIAATISPETTVAMRSSRCACAWIVVCMGANNKIELNPAFAGSFERCHPSTTRAHRLLRLTRDQSEVDSDLTDLSPLPRTRLPPQP